MTRDHTIKYEEVGCSNSGRCINYAMSLPIELSSRGPQIIYFSIIIKQIIFYFI